MDWKSILFGKKFVCSKCGEVGLALRVKNGNIIMEVLLWLLFLLPGIIYTTWRNATSYLACSSCGSRDIIPARSPKGKALIAQNEKL